MLNDCLAVNALVMSLIKTGETSVIKARSSPRPLLADLMARNRAFREPHLLFYPIIPHSPQSSESHSYLHKP